MNKARTLTAAAAALGALAVATATPAAAATTASARHYYVAINRCSMPAGTYTTHVARLRNRSGAINHAWSINSQYRTLKVVDKNTGATVLTLGQYVDGNAC